MRGDQQLFGAIDFTLRPGCALRVAGVNGSGKTSMLRILSGVAAASHGEVRWNGRDIRAIRDDYSSRRLYMGHASAIKDDLLAWENVAFIALLSGIRIGGRVRTLPPTPRYGVWYESERFLRNSS